MGEVLGVAASGVTLFELGFKVAHMVAAVKDAPETWQKYINGLHTVACLQSALDSCLSRYPRLKDLRGRISETEEGPLVDYVNEKLSVVRREAESVLHRCNPTVEPKEGRWRLVWDLLTKGRKRAEFLLRKVAVQELISVVEVTESHLHFTLTAVLLNSSESWRAQSEKLIVSILDEVRKSGETLDLLEKDGKRMWNAKIEVCLPPSAESCNSSVRDDASSFMATSSLLAEDSRVRWVVNKVTKTTKAVSKIRKRKPQSDQLLGGKRPLSSSAQTQQGETSSVLHDADNKPESAGQQVDQRGGCGVPTNSQLTTDGVPDFDIINENGKLFEVPTDSVEWRRAGDPNYPEIRRIDYTLNSIPPDCLKDVINKPAAQGVEVVEASAPAAQAQATEAATESTMSLAPLSLGPKSKLFVGKAVQLEACKISSSTRFRFCVQRVNSSDEEHVFDVMSPCSTMDGTRCEHVTMEVEDGVAFLVSLPACVILRSLEYLPCEGAPDDSRGLTSCALSLLSKCRGGDACQHTAVEQTGSRQPTCASQCSFYGFAFEEMILDGVLAYPNSTNSQDPFRLLRAVMSGEDLPPGSEIGLDLFVLFILAVKRHEDIAGEAGFRQARLWAEGMRRPSPLEDEGHTWLWVLWALQLREDFKIFSASILRDEKNLIVRQEGVSASPCRPTLPNNILEALNARRIDALSRVANLMLTEMQYWRGNYAENSEKIQSCRGQGIPPSTIGDMLRSSLAYGYLHLECGRCVMLHGPSSADLGFPGASFENIRTAILLMMDLGQWEVSSRLFNGLIANPVMATVFTIGGIDTSDFRSNFADWVKSTGARLRVLIDELDEQDWGIDVGHLAEPKDGKA